MNLTRLLKTSPTLNLHLSDMTDAPASKNKISPYKGFPLVPGIRLIHTKTGVGGLVVGSPESAGHVKLVPVIVEGSTRWELWPTHLTQPRPRSSQCSHFGGRFVPPKGFPMRIK